MYRAVMENDMVWFDCKMGSEGTVTTSGEDDAPIGAGGLMAKFAW